MKHEADTVDGDSAAAPSVVVGDILRCLSALEDMQRDARTGNMTSQTPFVPSWML